MAPALTDDLSQILLRMPEFVDQAVVALRLLDGVEILSLDVLDEGNLEGIAVR